MFHKKYNFVKVEEDKRQLEIPPLSRMFLCEQQGEEERWKEADTYTASTWIGCGTLLTKVFTLFETDDALSKIGFQDMCVLKHSLRVP